MAEFLTPYQTSKLLTGVIEADTTPRPNFFQTAFGTVSSTTRDTVNFDVEFGVKNVAAMHIDPDVDAPLIRLQGFGTKEMQFSYLKEGLAGADFTELNSRQLGQQFGADQNIMANYVANLQKKLTIAEQRFQNRFELNARDLLVNGTYTAESAYHAKVFYDFGRTIVTTDVGYLKGNVPEIDLTTLNGNGGVGKRAWGSTGGAVDPTPVKDFVKAAATAQRKGLIRLCLMSEDAYDEFFLDLKTNYADAWDLTKSVTDRTHMRITPEITKANDLNYRMSYNAGNGQEIDIYTLSSVMNNRDTGVEEAIMPDGYMLMLPAPMHGYKIYGRIMHLRAGYQALPRFINTWTDAKSDKMESEVHSNYVMGIPDANRFISWKVK